MFSMPKTEICELTVLCLLHSGGKYLLQNRVKADWQGYTLPGGHVEKGESIVDAVVREMKEETGLTVMNPRLCGVKQFPIDCGRYIVFLFEADEYSGELVSSSEGEMCWVDKNSLDEIKTVSDLKELIDVMLSDKLNEFQYVVDGDKWTVVLK